MNLLWKCLTDYLRYGIRFFYITIRDMMFYSTIEFNLTVGVDLRHVICQLVEINF